MTVDHKSAWLNSGEARKLMRVSTCQLAHLRLEGKLRFQKKGNAYLYSVSDCRKIADETSLGIELPCAVDRPEH